jgi:hypothetical protein
LHASVAANLPFQFQNKSDNLPQEDGDHLETEISHLESPVGRYRRLIVKDVELEQRLAASRDPALQTALIVVLVFLYFFGSYFFTLDHGLERFLWPVIANAVLLACVLQFRREHAVIANCGKAVGTVLLCEKLGQGRRARFRIKYGFFSVDHKLHIGKSSVPRPNLKEGQTLAILYDLNDPSRSLPLSGFCFYNVSEFLALPHAILPIADSLRANSPKS